LIEAARLPLQAAQTEHDALKKAYDLAVHDRKSREQDLAVQEQAISKLNDRAAKGEIKTNKEYQAHRFEVELAKKKKGEVEDELLLLMDLVDTKKKELSRAEEALKTSEQRFKTEKADLEGSVGALEEELAEITNRRKEIAADVEPSLLRTYDKLRMTRKGRALAGVTKEGSCMACRLQIEPQIVSDVKRAVTINACSYCQRILYWIGERTPAASEPAGASAVAGIQQTAEKN
jgi:predicted  nucleic acid-binding Zn-ribbon protein